MDELAYLGIMTPGEITLNVVRNDPADNRYLECAVEGAADYLVTGGQDLLDLHEHGGIRIMSPKTLLEVLRAHPERGAGQLPRKIELRVQFLRRCAARPDQERSSEAPGSPTPTSPTSPPPRLD